MRKWVLNNLWLKIVSMILAVGLWFYIHSEITRIMVQKTFENVPVRLMVDREKLLLTDYQLTISPKKVDVLLRGEKNQVEKIRESELKALVDASDISAEGIYNLPVKILLPENINITKQVNPSACQVTISGFKAPVTTWETAQ